MRTLAAAPLLIFGFAAALDCTQPPDGSFLGVNGWTDFDNPSDSQRWALDNTLDYYKGFPDEGFTLGLKLDENLVIPSGCTQRYGVNIFGSRAQFETFDNSYYTFNLNSKQWVDTCTIPTPCGSRTWLLTQNPSNFDKESGALIREINDGLGIEIKIGAGYGDIAAGQPPETFWDITMDVFPVDCPTCISKFYIKYNLWDYRTLTCDQAVVRKKWPNKVFYEIEAVQLTLKSSDAYLEYSNTLARYFNLVWGYKAYTGCTNFELRVTHRRTDPSTTLTPDLTDPEIVDQFQIVHQSVDWTDNKAEFAFEFRVFALPTFDWAYYDQQTAYFTIELWNTATGESAHYVTKVLLDYDFVIQDHYYVANFFIGNERARTSFSWMDLSLYSPYSYRDCGPLNTLSTYCYCSVSVTAHSAPSADWTNEIGTLTNKHIYNMGAYTSGNVYIDLYDPDCTLEPHFDEVWLKVKIDWSTCGYSRGIEKIVVEVTIELLQAETCTFPTWNPYALKYVSYSDSSTSQSVWPRYDGQTCGRKTISILDSNKVALPIVNTQNAAMCDVTYCYRTFEDANISIETREGPNYSYYYLTVTPTASASPAICGLYYMQAEMACHYDPADPAAEGKTMVQNPFYLMCFSTSFSVTGVLGYSEEFGSLHTILAPVFSPSMDCGCEEINYLWTVPAELTAYISSKSDTELVLGEASPLGVFTISIRASAVSTEDGSINVARTKQITLEITPCTTLNFDSVGEVEFYPEEVTAWTRFPLLTTTSVECPFYTIETSWTEEGSAFFSDSETSHELEVQLDTPAGTYFIKQTDCEPTINLCQETTLTIVIPEKPNTAPYLDGTFKSEYFLECPTTLELPQATDNEEDEVTIDIVGLPDFIDFQDGLFEIRADCVPDLYHITVILTDSKGLFKKYQTKFVVQEEEEIEQFAPEQPEPEPELIVEEEPEPWVPPYAQPVWVATISRLAVVTLRFAEPVIPPSFKANEGRMLQDNEEELLPLNEIVTSESMIIEIDRTDQPGKEEVKWECIDFTSTQIQFQLFLKQPLQVSMQKKQYISIQFLDENLFKSLDHRSILNGFMSLELTYFVPTQLPSKQELVVIERQIVAAESIGVVSLIVTLIIQFVAKKVMSKMWGFFAAIQIVILITADNYSFQKPANVETFIGAVKGIINLEAMKQLLKQISGSSYVWIEEQDPTLQQTAGMMLSVLALVILTCLCFLLSACKSNKYVQKAQAMVFWNLLIRFFMVSFINLLYQNMFSLSQGPSVVSSISGSVIIAFIIVIWAVSARYIKRADPVELDKEETRKKVGNLYLNLETQPYKKLHYSQLFFWQRALIIITVIFLNKQVLQALVLQGLLMWKLCYFAAHKPYRSFDEGLSDGLNDVFLVIIHSLQFIISPYVPPDLERYNFGKYFNISVYLMLAFNGLLVVFGIGKSVYLDQRKKSRKKQAQKLQANAHKLTETAKFHEYMRKKKGEPEPVKLQSFGGSEFLRKIHRRWQHVPFFLQDLPKIEEAPREESSENENKNEGVRAAILEYRKMVEDAQKSRNLYTTSLNQQTQDVLQNQTLENQQTPSDAQNELSLQNSQLIKLKSENQRLMVKTQAHLHKVSKIHVQETPQHNRQPPQNNRVLHDFDADRDSGRSANELDEEFERVRARIESRPDVQRKLRAAENRRLQREVDQKHLIEQTRDPNPFEMTYDADKMGWP